MRLIDADALAASLGITNMDCPKCGWYNGRGCKRGSDFVDACEAIEDAPTIDTDVSGFSDKLWKTAYERGKAESVRWIPVSERLPQFDKEVLTSDCYGNVWIESLNKYSDGSMDWWNEYGSTDFEDILAWQPLSAPYKGGN